MDHYINYFFTHIEVCSLLLALALSGISLTIRWKVTTANEKRHIVMMYLLLFAVGMNYLWQAIFYAFMPQTAAMVQRHLPSPFEWQISAAYFGIAVIAIIAAFKTDAFRTAAIILTCSTVWGAMVTTVCLSFSSPAIATQLISVLTLCHLVLPALLIGLRKKNINASIISARAAR